MAALTTKCACQNVGTVLELLNRGLYPLGGFGGDANGTAEHTGDSHGAHARQPSHVTHRGLAVHGQRQGPMPGFVRRFTRSRLRQFDLSRNNLPVYALAELPKVKIQKPCSSSVRLHLRLLDPTI